MKDKGLTIFIALLIAALIALFALVAIGVIGDRAKAEAVGYTRKTVVKRVVTYTHVWKDEHAELVEVWYSDGTRGSSARIRKHTYNHWGKCDCGMVNVAAFAKGLRENLHITNDNNSLYGVLVESTAITEPIRYINTNESISGKFIVNCSCYTAPYSANLIAEYGANFTLMKYWSTDEYGNVTYEFIDETTGAITFAHEGDFEIIEIEGSIEDIDVTTENATPASAIDAATTTERIFITTNDLLEDSTLESIIDDDDIYSGEIEEVDPDMPVMFDNHSRKGSYVVIDEDDIDTINNIYIIDIPTMVGESQDQDGTR